jgi:hyaluronoglucosaminidase
MTIRRLLVGAALGVLASIALAAPTSAAAEPTYPPSVGGLTVSATTVAPGGSVTVTGSGFMAGSTVTVTVTNGGVVVASFTVTANSAGVVSASLALTASGTNTITLTGVDPNGAARVLVSTVFVVPSAASGSGSGLPNTGASIGTPLALGGVLILSGAGVVLATRRRRRRGTAAAG